MAAFFVVSSIAMLTTPRARVRADDAGLDAFDVDDVETLFSIRKSANRNRVDYGLRLDAACQSHRGRAGDPVLADARRR
jgi:hypothetical protein